MTMTATPSYVEQLVADHPELQATRHECYTLAGQLWVKVDGGQCEAHAWQAATGGRILSSYVSGGIRRQMIIGARVNVEVIDDPAKAGA